MNLGELIVELSLDSTQFAQELDKVKQNSVASIKKLEKSLDKGFNLKINTSSLDKLNKSLENTLNKYNTINQYFKANPIVVSVDKTQVDDLSKTLTNIKRKVNIKTELSSTSRKESVKAGEDVADGFVKGAETIKTKKTKVVNEFKEIINDIKDVFSISSPSKVMEAIGLDVGKGFENGVIASMLLASKRISDAYEKTLDKIIKSPKATQTQKQSAKNLQGEVQRELELYARLMREDRMPFPEEQKQAAKDILDKAQQNAKKAGLKTEEIRALAQAAKKEADAIINPPKSAGNVANFEEFKREFLVTYNDLLQRNAGADRIYKIRREMEGKGKVSDKSTFNKYLADLIADEEVDLTLVDGAIQEDFALDSKQRWQRSDYFKYDKEAHLKAMEDSYHFGDRVRTTIQGFNPDFDLEAYIAKIQSTSPVIPTPSPQSVKKEPVEKEPINKEPAQKEVVQKKSVKKKPVVPDIVQELPKIAEESIAVVIEQAKTANRTIDDIFKDIATISKDAVTILQKYGTDISAIPSRNTKQIKEVSKTELSGFIKELESMGFEVIKATKSRAKTTKQTDTPKPVIPEQNDVIEQAKTANRTIDDIFKDIATISKDAVTILQKYGTDISAIPSRNTKQIKEVSKTELSGFIKELESMGFEVTKATKSKAKAKVQKEPVVQPVQQEPEPVVQPIKKQAENAVKSAKPVANFEEFKQEFLITYNDLLQQNAGADRIYKIRREMESRGNVSDKGTFNKYLADLIADEEVDLTLVDGALQEDFALDSKQRWQRSDYFKYDEAAHLKAREDSYHFGDRIRTTIQGFNPDFDLEAYIAKIQSTRNSKPAKQEQQSTTVNEVKQAKAANRTIETIFNDIAAISKDAVTILQKYGADISAIPSRNTKQIKEVSKTELSGLIQELQSMGFEVVKATKSKAKTTKSKTKTADTALGNINAIGESVLDGLDNGLEGVEKIADKAASDFIKGFKRTLGINSPSLLMVEMGLMIASGLFLGIQKGDSKVAEGARKIVDTLTNTLKPVKEIADPVLGAAGAIPALSSFGTYGSAAFNVADTGLKMLGKVGERHEANPDEMLFQSIGGSIKDLVTSIKSDETLTAPREAFDHVINIVKAGASGLGADSSVITSIDAAQAGATALLRNSAIIKAIVQSHVQTREKVEADPSVDYLATFKAVLVDNLQGLKLNKGEILKALGSAMKVVPTGIGTAADSNFAMVGEVFSSAPDALVPVLDVYRKVKREKSQGKSTKEAVASGLTDVGVPSQMANVFGSAADKFSPQLKTFVTAGKNINEGLSKGILNTTALVTTAIEVTGNAVQKQMRKNMGIDSPSKVIMDIGSMIPLGLSIGIKEGADKVEKSVNIVTNGLANIDLDKDFKDMGVNTVNAFASGVEQQSKSSSGRVKKVFNDVVADVKDTLQIQSPSKIMEWIGLNFGKGFESGAIASLALSSSRISDAYKDIVEKMVNDPSVSQSRKQALQATKDEIDKDLQQFAEDYSKGKFASEADAMQQIQQIYSRAQGHAAGVSAYQQIDVSSIYQDASNDVQESQEDNYVKILSNLFDSFANQDLRRFVMNLEKAFEPFQDFITFDIGNLFEYFQGMVDSAIQSLQQLTDVMVQVESTQRKLDYLGGSKSGGANEMKFALATANEFRVPAEAAADAYAQLSLAAKDTKLEGKGVQNLFKGISASISALGLSSMDAEGAFMAYTQMLSKGKISMEELRQQLSERFPPAMGIFSKALNVTTAELNDLASKGALLSDVTLSKVADTLLAEYGGAAKGMKGVGMSLTALGNSMYTIAVKATDAFSGLFSSVIDIFGGIVKSIENSFDSIIKIVGLAGAAMAFALSGTLLGVLSKIPALTVALTSFIGLIKTTFVSGLGIIIAGIPGILAVFLDGFLSAENSITNTLTRAAKNLLGFIFQMVDSIKRNLTGSGLFEVNIGQQKSNPFQGIIDGATKLFNMIPKGVIQMVALVAAFHQLRALGMRAGIFDAISTGFTAIKSIAPAVFASISAGFAGLKAGAISVGATIKASIGGALKTLGALAVQMVLALGVMALAKSDFSNPMQDAVDTMATNINTSLSTIEQSFKNIQESVNNTTQSTSNLASGVKSVVDSIPSKGLQLDILYILGVKSKGYTTDDQIKDINKALANQNPEGLGARENAAYNMQMTKLSVEARAKNIAELRRQQNEARNKGDNQLVDNLEKRIKNNYSFSPFTNNAIDKYLNNPASMQSQVFRDKIAKEERDRLKQLGLSQDQINARNKFFKGTDIVRGTDSQVTEGAKQVLSSTAAFSKRLEELKNSIKTSGLDSSANYLKTGAGATKQRIDEIKKIDQQIAGLGMRRVEAVKSGDLAKLTEIDKQIRNLQRQRETKSQDFKDQLSAAQAISKEADAFARKLEELGIPIAGELRKAIDEMKALGKQAEETIKKSVPINVMDDLYRKTKTSLDNFQSAFDKFSNNIEIGSAQRTQSIYTPGATQGDTNLLSQQSDIVALQQQVLANRSKLNISSQALTLMRAIPSQTSEQAAEVEDLQGVVREDALNLATNEAALQKAKYDIQQTIKDFNDQIEDYVKNITAEIKTIELDTKKANLQMQQQKFSANFRSALFNIIDTELTSLSNAFEKFITSLNDAAMNRLDEEQIGIDLQNKLNSLDDGYENLIENMPTGRQLQGLEQARIDTLKMLSVYDESNSKIQETIRGAETQAASLNRQVNNTVSNTAKISPNIDKATSSTAQFTEELKRAADTAEQLALSTNQLANSNSGIYSNAMSAGTNTQVSSTATANTGSQNQSRQSTQPPTTRSNFIQQGINNLNNVLTGFGLRPVNPQQPVRPPAPAAGAGIAISNVYGTGVNTGAASAATEKQKQAETQRSNAKRLALQQTRVTNLIKGINDFILEMEKVQRSSSTDDLSRLDSFYQIMREVNQDVKITNNTRDQVNPLSRIAQNARKTVNGYIQTEKRLLEERSDISLQLSDKEGGILSQFNKLKKIIDTEISKTQDPKLKKQLEEAKGRAQTALDAATASAKDRRAEIDQQLAKMAGAGLTTRKRDKQGNVTGIEPTQKLIDLFENIINIENELQEKQDKIEEYSNDISYVEKLIEGYDLKLQLHPGIVLSESDRKKIVEQKILLLSTQNEQQYLQKQISIGQQFQEDRDLIKYNQRLQLAKTEFEEAKKNLVIQQDIIIRDLDKQAEDLKKAAQILNEDLDTTGTYARKRLDIQRNLNDLIETINNTQFDSDPTKNAEMQIQAAEKASQRALIQNEELDKEIKDNLLSRNPLLEMEIQRLQRGNADPFVVNRMQRDLATSKWQEEYSTRRDDINKDQGLTPEEKTQAISILDGINAAKLREIADSFKTFGQALADSAISTGLQSLKDGLADLITNDLIIGFDGATGKTRDLSNELRGFERVIYNVSKAVLNAMTKILVDAAVNKLFGKDGLLDIGKIFGAAKGGIVPNYAEGGSVGEIGKAMQRERSQNGGKQPVLAVLTPGERVLTVSENKRFEALQLERFLQPSAVMPEEIAYRKINNYAFGGVVGMNPVPMGSYAQGQSDNSTTINIPVTVENNGNSNDSQLDANSLQNVVRSAVLTEIQRQQRQGGILRR